MINLPDDVSVHVFKGVKLMDIYDKTTGFPRLDNELLRKNEDKTVWERAVVRNREIEEEDGLDKPGAKNRNRKIEEEVDILREYIKFLNDSYSNIDDTPIVAMEERIEDLLEERDELTYRFKLAGKEFERLYLKKKESIVGREFTDDELLDPKLLVREEEDKRSEFNRITSEMLELYSQKNTDYGDAFTQSLDEDGLLVSKIRMKDKLNRFSQLINNDALVNDESIRDTLIDLANYTVMTLMWLDENE